MRNLSICNLNKSGIFKRKIIFLIGAVLVLAFSFVYLLYPKWYWLFIILPISVFAFLNWFQFRNSFCVLYGFTGKTDFGGLVMIDENRKETVRFGYKILWKSIILGLLYSLLIYCIVRLF
jgi:preprotein translocase subunit Sec63